jgi:uncharacterized protein YbbK (DUF523 family)/uncharacterized protein YbgA (DUF1722 family)
MTAMHRKTISYPNRETTCLNQEPLRIGISQCLLGDHVRYDGGHKRNIFVTDVLAPFVQWLPACPEAEAGLGIPREAMCLTGDPASPTLLTLHTKIDMTNTLTTFSQHRIQELGQWDLDGYIFKKNSPSCGVNRVKVITEKGQQAKHGTGIFAAHVLHAFPLLPVEEEGRLSDPRLRGNFIQRLFGYRRWKTFIQQKRMTRAKVVQFHTHHKYLLLTHSRVHHHKLGQLIAQSEHCTPHDLVSRYGELFMNTLKVKATVQKHANVLQQLARHLRKYLNTVEQAELQKTIQDYHQHLMSLAIPLTLIQQHVRDLAVPNLVEQVYLNYHPQELMLQNHVQQPLTHASQQTL